MSGILGEKIGQVEAIVVSYYYHITKRERQQSCAGGQRTAATTMDHSVSSLRHSSSSNPTDTATQIQEEAAGLIPTHVSRLLLFLSTEVMSLLEGLSPTVVSRKDINLPGTIYILIPGRQVHGNLYLLIRSRKPWTALTSVPTRPQSSCQSAQEIIRRGRLAE